MLGIRPEDIVNTTLLPTHLRKESQEEKLGILDVRVLLNGNVQINMEMQMAPFELWAERSLFYLGKMYVDQIKAGEDYDVLKKCIHTVSYTHLNPGNTCGGKLYDDAYASRRGCQIHRKSAVQTGI